MFAPGATQFQTAPRKYAQDRCLHRGAVCGQQAWPMVLSSAHRGSTMPPLELRGWASFSASATANEELADLGDDLVAAPVRRRQHPSDNDRTAVHPPRQCSCGPGSVRTTLFRTMPRSFEWAHRQVPFVGFADACLRGIGQVRSAWAACVCLCCVLVLCACTRVCMRGVHVCVCHAAAAAAARVEKL